MRDLRDPTELGRKLLFYRHASPAVVKTSVIADEAPLHVRDYDANPGPIEKYGDPTKLPSTMPNAVE
jgi:hypothetical protein